MKRDILVRWKRELHDFLVFLEDLIAYLNILLDIFEYALVSGGMRHLKFDSAYLKRLYVDLVVEHFFWAALDVLDVLHRVVKLQNSAVGICIPKIGVKVFHFCEDRESIIWIMH